MGMKWTYFDAENVGWKAFLSVSSAFVLSFLFPVRVRIIVGGVGDVTNALGALWTLGTGIATFASLVLAIRNQRDSGSESGSTAVSSGPDTRIHIKTVEGDLHLSGTLDSDEEGRSHESDDSNEEERAEKEAKEDGPESATTE
jgi:hypothetical protein